MASGPLQGLKVLELGGVGTGPFCGMFLSDLGADVVRVERPGAVGLPGLTGTKFEFDARGRRSVILDLKTSLGVEACLGLIEAADVLIESYRPGVMERLGLGPEVALERSPRLVYGRITGWGQTGPLAHAAGHDANFIAISGVLATIGTAERPVMPLNLIGDYGGALVHLIGVLAAVLHARATGVGQVIDTAMSDSAAYITTIVHSLVGAGFWRDQRESNILDGGAPWCATYLCKDDQWIAISPDEPKFFALLLDKLGLSGVFRHDQYDPAGWDEMRGHFIRTFLTKTRQEWCELLEGTDACFAPVLSPREAPSHPHNRARGTFIDLNGAVQPAPVPAFSVTPARIQSPPPKPGQHTIEVLHDWSVKENVIEGLRANCGLG